MKRKLSLLACTTWLFATTASAEGNWIVGLVVDGGQSPYAGADASAELFPYVAYETDRLHIGVDEISYDLISRDNLDITVMIAPRFSPDFPDTALFEGLDRNDAIEAGFAATYSLGDAYAALSLQGDVSGAHDGFSGKAALGYDVEIGLVTVDLSAGVKMRDANLNNYLYGVGTDEATADRPAFKMDNTINGFAEITAMMPLAPKMFLVGEVSYTDLGDAFDSPLIDRKSKTDLIIGVAYQF